MENTRPTDLILHQASHALEVAFADGVRYRLPCEYLRVESPRAYLALENRGGFVG